MAVNAFSLKYALGHHKRNPAKISKDIWEESVVIISRARPNHHFAG